MQLPQKASLNCRKVLLPCKIISLSSKITAASLAGGRLLFYMAGSDGYPYLFTLSASANFEQPEKSGYGRQRPQRRWLPPGRQPAGRAVLVPSGAPSFSFLQCYIKEKCPAFQQGIFGAPSAGALRKRSIGTFLATGPRELNTSRQAKCEPAPKGMVHKKIPQHSLRYFLVHHRGLEPRTH